MKTLYLLRHAKSSWKDADLDDFDRPLKGRGRRAGEAMGLHLAEKGRIPDLVLCSTARRTVETLDLLSPHLGGTTACDLTADLYGAGAGSILGLVARQDDHLKAIMVIGHNPGLETLARELTGGGRVALRRTLEDKFPTGALAVLTADVDHWKDLRPGGAKLKDFVRPVDLDTDLAGGRA
ncbi:MAG: histidine phosphatase family protein [Rhodobacterales bacterium]|nr:histidine phosphatase family protein [Rhodobacterales bacterium]